MGAFELQHGSRRIILPNTLHDEGAEEWLGYLFPSQGAKPSGFKIGLSGLNTDAPTGKPNPGQGTSDTGATYGAVLADSLNPHGGHHETLRDLLELDEQSTTFTVTLESGGVRIETDWHEFENALDWSPTPDSWYESQDPPQQPPYAWKAPTVDHVHRYPWQKPVVRAETLRAAPEIADPIPDSIAANMDLGCSLPIGCVFVRSAAGRLWVSAVPKRPIILRPEQSIHVRWVGRICPSLTEDGL
ncbi:MAG: hypothetical protein GY842_06295 [bacterium]|nr:hypothetical protein [bacterium]